MVCVHCVHNKRIYLDMYEQCCGREIEHGTMYQMENYSKMDVTFANRCIIVSGFITLLSETNLFLDFVPSFEY